MQAIATYSLEELLRERREGAVRGLIRAIGYALTRGGNPEGVGRFLFESYRHSGEYRRLKEGRGAAPGAAFAARHLLDRWGWCDDVQIRHDGTAITVESNTMLTNHNDVLGFHGVTRLDVEACMETLWRLSGQELGLDVTYTIGGDRDWMLVRAIDGSQLSEGPIEEPRFTAESLAAHRRLVVASSVVCSIGFAKFRGDEPEDLGQFFYRVWEGSGHYDKLRERYGYGNALAYAQSLAQSRQVLYRDTSLVEDLDGYTVTSPGWGTEIPLVMGIFGVLPDDVYRYFTGGGVAACAKLGLQYADQSDDRHHRVWIRSR